MKKWQQGEIARMIKGEIDEDAVRRYVEEEENSTQLAHLASSTINDGSGLDAMELVRRASEIQKAARQLAEENFQKQVDSMSLSTLIRIASELGISEHWGAADSLDLERLDPKKRPLAMRLSEIFGGLQQLTTREDNAYYTAIVERTAKARGLKPPSLPCSLRAALTFAVESSKVSEITLEEAFVDYLSCWGVLEEPMMCSERDFYEREFAGKPEKTTNPESRVTLERLRRQKALCEEFTPSKPLPEEIQSIGRRHHEGWWKGDDTVRSIGSLAFVCEKFGAFWVRHRSTYQKHSKTTVAKGKKKANSLRKAADISNANQERCRWNLRLSDLLRFAKESGGLSSFAGIPEFLEQLAATGCLGSVPTVKKSKAFFGPLLASLDKSFDQTGIPATLIESGFKPHHIGIARECYDRISSEIIR